MYQKIIITSNTSWFISNFFSSSIVEFMRNNNTVHVVAPRDKYTQKLIDLGCDYHELAVDRSGINVFDELKTVGKLYRLFSELQPDCVLNFTPKLNIYSVVVCRMLKINVVNSIAGLGSIVSESGLKSMIGRLLLRITQPLSDHIVFQNNDDLAIYLKYKFVKEEKTSRVKGIGVELNRFVPCPPEDDGTVRFIMFARMLKNKGVVDFVKAAQAVDEHYRVRKLAGYHVPQYEFSLLGFIDEANPNGLSRAQLEHWNEHSVVSYLGETDDIFSVVKKYDCVVLPSYYREGIPQCLIESCAMGKPIITTNNVGCKETVIHKRTGYIVQPKCVPDLKEAMIRMIELPHAERVAMGKRARAKAERDYGHIDVAKHYMNIMKKLMKRNTSK